MVVRGLWSWQKTMILRTFKYYIKEWMWNMFWSLGLSQWEAKDSPLYKLVNYVECNY